jgi:hypothetical protein
MAYVAAPGGVTYAGGAGYGAGVGGAGAGFGAGGGGMMAGSNGGMVVGGGAVGVARTGVASGGGGGACCTGESNGGGELGCGGEVQTGGSMSFVGGGGSYVLEQTYRYVGAGRGSHEVVGSAKANYCMPLSCGLFVVALVIIIIAVSGCSTTTTTVMPENVQDCLMWGDPHLQTFDGSFPNIYGQGEFWVVKSDKVSIQARYMATPFTNGLAATHQVVVGGEWMQGHRLAVGPMDNGQITCDDQPILLEFPSNANCGPISVTYNDYGTLVDDAQGDLEKRIVHIGSSGSNPEVDVHLQVMRWANHLNVRITMPPQGNGQDGTCGNFNHDPSDDSTSAITARLNGRVPMSELLFHRKIEATGQVTKTIADCEMSKRDHAVKLCKEAQPSAGGVLLDSCVFDVCFGGDQYAAQDGLTEGQVQA